MCQYPWQYPDIQAHCRLMADSYQHWTGGELAGDEPDPALFARRLYEASFVLVSHGTEQDPLFNFGNLAAQRLWELDWGQLVGMPSRRSAESVAQDDRSEALKSALCGGWVSGYSGVRISASGQRFLIRGGIIWNLLDAQGGLRGQAACFSDWDIISSA